MNNGHSRAIVHSATILLFCVFNTSLLWAQDIEGGDAATARSIKETVSTDLKMMFSRQMDLIEKRRSSWLQRAKQAMPKLNRMMLQPVAVIAVEKDPDRFQGWKTVQTDTPASICNKPMVPGDSFILDFGDHLTGFFSLSLRHFDIPVDAPVRLELIFGEVPAEVAEPFDSYTGWLSRSWLQDEIVNIDVVPQTVRLPRRYAFRYVKVRVIAASTHGRFGFAGFSAEAVTSAEDSKLMPFTPQNEQEAALDRVSRRTLRNCMQTVFEDGPKRDRRLWLGDLRLQAQANYVTYRHYGLVKRSLYILAGTADQKGLVSTCAFEDPEPVRGGDTILDYTALFAPTVLDYLEASGDTKTARDLWPLVLKQLDFTLEPVDARGLFITPENWWCFVDWNESLDKQAAEQAIILYGLKSTLKLAERIGREKDTAFIPDVITCMESAAQRRLWDEKLGLFVSGPDRQVSWASQAWMVLAGVPAPQQARRAMTQAAQHPDIHKPAAPYLHHHVVAAMLKAGLRDEAMVYLHDYWGGMLRQGADTFWEVYVPGENRLSPYGNHLINSYCHAWSCTPSYFLRTYGKPQGLEGQK